MGQLCSTPPKTHIKASVALSQEYKGVLFESINGDIIDAEAEAIINAANQQLIHNNGLGNSLLAKGGQTIQEESNKVKQEFEAEIPIGQAVVTSAGNLKAKYIIHVISPIWNGGSNNEEAKLGECVTNALAQAEKHKLKSIAVPSLDGGVFGFPRESAAKIIVEQCVQYINANQPTSIQTIKFINTNAVTVSAFKTAIQNSLLKAGGLNGESVQLAREDVVERETTTATETEISHQEERVVRSHKPVEHHVEQRPETVEPISEEKKAEVPVPEAAIEQVAEKTVEQAIEQAVEQVVEEKQQEEAPAVVEPVVEEQPAVVEEQKPVEEVVEQPAAVEEKTVEEQAAVVEEQAAVVEEQAAAVEEKPVEEQPAVVEQPAEEEKPVEEQHAVVEEQKPVEEVVEQPAAVEEKQEEAPALVEEKQEEAPAVVEEKQEEAPAVVEEKQEEQPAVVEEEKTEEVADETKTEATTETQETKETEGEEKTEEQGEAAAEEGQNEGEQGGKKKKNKKKGKRNN